MTSYCWHLDDRQRCLTKYSFVGSLFTSGALWARGPYCRVACGVDRKAPFALTQDPSLSPPCPCSVQSPKEMLSDGVNSETSGDQGHFRGCRIFHGISASHFTSAGPITGCPLQLRLLTHSFCFLKTRVYKCPLRTSSAICASLTSPLHTS